MIITAAELAAKRLAGLANIMSELEKEIIFKDEAEVRSVLYDVSNKQIYVEAIMKELMEAGYSVKRKTSNVYTRDRRPDMLLITWK